MDFDHVALATDDAGAALRVLVGELGGTVMSGGSPGPFRAMQLRMGSAEDGMTIELLEPGDLTQGDFLRRFLDRHGEGPHHLTFKTDDIGRELARMSDLGLEPVGVQIESSIWREFFLHPARGIGTVIQIAQLMKPDLPIDQRMERLSPWSDPWWPSVERGGVAAILDQVVLGSPDPERTCGFLVEVLGGTVGEHGTVSWGRDRVRIEESPNRGVLRLDLRGLEAPRTVAGGLLSPA